MIIKCATVNRFKYKLHENRIVCKIISGWFLTDKLALGLVLSREIRKTLQTLCKCPKIQNVCCKSEKIRKWFIRKIHKTDQLQITKKEKIYIQNTMSEKVFPSTKLQILK
jgi:hypothetical protein